MKKITNVIAFFIAKQNSGLPAKRAKYHLEKLANRFRHTVETFDLDGFSLTIVGGVIEEEIDPKDSVLVNVGSVFDKDYEWDRHLIIKIESGKLEVTNDYAGSIPVYFSYRNGFFLSNIEPCIFLATAATLNDLSPENVFGFLKYSHFIWEETAWKHIFQMLPDSRYVFSPEKCSEEIEYLRTVASSDERANFSDSNVASDLYELNKDLVTRSLSNIPQLVLPLSSGYDSRMIFSVLANNRDLASRTKCFTYGSIGSVEVEAARALAKRKMIDWHFIDLKCRFLERNYLEDIGDVFGASLHMHGMYQLEFFEQIRNYSDICGKSCVTSGFMTGVPAGQHNGLLNIRKADDNLSEAMHRFSQSNFWSIEELRSMPFFNGKDYSEIAESRFRAPFDRFDGAIYQKSVIFDIWTRQRNFISYYPRTFEWLLPVVSPHMNAQYANFFMSLSERHLHNRRSIELMFSHHYNDLSRVISNSNGLASIGGRRENMTLSISRILSRMHISWLLPKYYWNKGFEFDATSVKKCGRGSFYPLLDIDSQLEDFLDLFGGKNKIEACYRSACNGDIKAYCQATTLQSLAMNLSLINRIAL